MASSPEREEVFRFDIYVMNVTLDDCMENLAQEESERFIKL
ncbi:hypothetical protein LOAG_12626 [Loa loa]|uniref:Uncharacterized protein n=1 Tax=Loa loa TaxID=7209 RepID=A0A1S0TLD3_LOALO|nr:hypothetical protein LOAG_12626 [Loa loa]EFO15883.1 hypothetical protein LOAG_12626 [Loa loa]